MKPALTRRSALALIAAAAAPLGAHAQDAAAPEAAATEPAVVPLEERGYALGDQIFGDPDAPVEMVEYVSYTCPSCKNFHDNIWPGLASKYVETGKLRIVYREFYRNQLDVWAGMVARCGGESAYFPLGDRIFDGQAEWTRAANAQEMTEGLIRIGRAVGMPDERLEACLTDQELLESMIVNFEVYKDDPVISGTPTIVLEGEKIEYGDLSIPYLSERIDAALGDG